MTDHTPGPWTVVERPDMNTHAITGDGGAILAYVHDPQDARLIAAAPELLVALQVLVALDDGDSPTLWAYAKEFDAARAAIVSEMASRLGVSFCAIRSILTGRTWSHLSTPVEVQP